MNFRGSTYLPNGAFYDVRDTIWFEAHETENGFAVAKLTGNPGDIIQPWDLASRLNFLRRQPPKMRQTLPSSAIVVDTVSNKEEALAAILSHEVEMLRTHKLVDIGDFNLRRIKHYISLIDEDELPQMPVPSEILKAVNNFGMYVKVRFLFGAASRETERDTSGVARLYNKLALA